MSSVNGISSRECGLECSRQPVVQLVPTRRLFLKLDFEAKIGNVYSADLELVERFSAANAVTFGSRFGFRPSDGLLFSATAPSEHDLRHSGEAHAGRRETDSFMGEACHAESTAAPVADGRHAGYLYFESVKRLSMTSSLSCNCPL